jgi:metallo-beta-lactamase class B
MFAKFTFASLAGVLAASTPIGDAPNRPLPVTAEQWASQCEPWDKWDKPAPPYRIHGNTYYVGTCGIAAILILGIGEHILIDSGTVDGAKVILSNIEALGVDPKEISFLAYSHEHFDHVGGHAIIQQATGAAVVAGAGVADVLESGQVSADDPQFTIHEAMTPVKVTRELRAPRGLNVSGVSISAIATPGHSPGALTWYWKSCEGDDCKHIVYADSLSPVSSDDYRFSDNPRYVEAYINGLARLSQLGCDILLTPHPSHSKMVERAAGGSLSGGLSCTDYAAQKMQDLAKRLEEEHTSDKHNSAAEAKAP